MRLLTQGFETRTTSGLIGSVANYGPVPRISGVAVDASLLIFQFNPTNDQPVSEFYTRFAYGIRGSDSGPTIRFRVRNTENVTLFHLHFGLNTFIDVHLAGSTTPSETIPIQMQLGWYVFEVHYRYTNLPSAAPDYNIEIKIDGLMRYQSTEPTSSSPDSPFEGELGHLDYGVFTRAYFDDIALNDTTGSRDNSWCGDGHIIALTPSADAGPQQFVGSDGNSVNNYQLVDEFPVNLTAGAGDYVESSVNGQSDFYQTTDPNPPLKADDVVRRVWVSATMREQSADGDQAKLGVRSGAQTTWSEPIPLGVDFRELRGEDIFVNPATGQPWTNAALNTVDIGVQAEAGAPPEE